MEQIKYIYEIKFGYTVKLVYNGHPWGRLTEVSDKTEILTGR
jgi:hypothetical protein